MRVLILFLLCVLLADIGKLIGDVSTVILLMLKVLSQLDHEIPDLVHCMTSCLNLLFGLICAEQLGKLLNFSKLIL